MGIRRHKKHPDTWIIEWYPEGRRKDPKTGKPNTKRETYAFKGSEHDARALYAEFLKKAGKAPRIAPTLNDIINEYLIYYTNKNSSGTVSDWTNAWCKLQPIFGQLRPAQITPAMIETYKTARTLQVKPVTVNKELIYFKGIINWMTDHNYCDPLTFKIKGFPRNKTRPPEVIVPVENQVFAILAQAIQPQRDIFTIIYLCGLRRAEALNLTVNRVNIAGGYILVMGKGNKERIVPLSSEAKGILERHIDGKKPTEYVWINPHTGKPFVEIGFALKRAALRAGVDMRVYPHLFRHSTFTHLAQLGANAFQIQALAGHSDIATSQKYVHMGLKGLTELVGKLQKE